MDITDSRYTEPCVNTSAESGMVIATPTTILDWAIKYAQQKWHVIQVYGLRDNLTCRCAKSKHCPSPGKHPIEPGWPDKATCDVEIIKNMNWDNMNIGIVTGSVSDLYVLDTDLKNDGPDNLAQWELENVQLLPQFIVETGGGGFHYYFPYPKDFNFTGKAIKKIIGVDIRADRQFVVAPPSRHYLGGKYVWGV